MSSCLPAGSQTREEGEVILTSRPTPQVGSSAVCMSGLACSMRTMSTPDACSSEYECLALILRTGDQALMRPGYNLASVFFVAAEKVWKLGNEASRS